MHEDGGPTDERVVDVADQELDRPLNGGLGRMDEVCQKLAVSRHVPRPVVGAHGNIPALREAVPEGVVVQDLQQGIGNAVRVARIDQEGLCRRSR